MIHVFIASINYHMSDSKYKKYFSQLPPLMKENVTKYRVKEDRYRTLVGKILLLRYLTKYTNATLDDVKLTEYKKPYLENQSIDFSISHSGEYVIVAFSKNTKIGIDIEYLNKNIDLCDFNSVFLEHEIKEIHNANNKIEKFYKIWTLKEALLKAEGKGLFENLKDVKIANNKIFFKNKVYNSLSLTHNHHLFSIVYKSHQKIVIDEIII